MRFLLILVTTAACGSATGPTDMGDSDAGVSEEAFVVEVATEEHDFGSVVEGIESAGYQLVVSNAQGSGAVNVAISGDESSFSVIDNCDGKTLATAGDECTIDVTFLPNGSGEKTLSFSFSSPHNDSLSKEVTMLGEGLVAATDLSFSTNVIDFGTKPLNANTTNNNVTLTNSGTGTVTLNWSVTGSDASSYSISQSCPSLAPGASCSVSPGFSPKSIIGNKSATLLVQTSNGTQSVSLTGKGSATVTVTAPTDGRIYTTGNQINCGDGNNVCSKTFENDADQSLTIRSSQASHYLDSWTSGCSGSNVNCSLQMTGNKTVSASFLPYVIVYGQIDTSNNSSGYMSISAPSGTYGQTCMPGPTNDACKPVKPGTSVTVSAYGSANNSFHWSHGCPNGNSCTVTVNNSSITVSAFDF